MRFYAEALRLPDATFDIAPEVRRFTLHLSRAVADKATDPDLKSFASFMRRRVADTLRRADLRFAVSYWFTVEAGHRAGEGFTWTRACRSLQLLLARALPSQGPLYALPREGDEGRFQLRMVASPDLGWSGYCAKKARWSRPSSRPFLRRHKLER